LRLSFHLSMRMHDLSHELASDEFGVL